MRNFVRIVRNYRFIERERSSRVLYVTGFTVKGLDTIVTRSGNLDFSDE